MNTLAERIKRALADSDGLTQADLARACNISTASVNNWFSGETKSLRGENLIRVASLLGVSPIWLSSGKGPMRADEFEVSTITMPKALTERRAQLQRRYIQAAVGESGAVYAHHPDDAPGEDAVLIKESRMHFSAGNGHQVSYELVEESEPATYRLSWFQREGMSPAKVRRFKVKGDSMEPFLYQDDSVLVNLAENDPARIIDGKVYALRYGDDLRVKRLFRKLDGTLTLRSDNPAYKDEDVPPALAEEHITIIGRVRDKSGAGGL